MRTKELKTGTKYATENGTCVETFDVVERGWYRYRAAESGKEDENVVRKGLPGESPENDPWSTGGGTSRSRYLKDGKKVLRDIVEGVRVTAHRVDGEGNSISSFESVVDPKYIKGTWEDYVRLHGDVLKSEAYKLKAGDAAKAESLRLSDKLKRAGLGENATVSVTVQYMVDDRHRQGDLTETSWLGRGQKAKGYRLKSTLVLTDEAVESALDSIIFDGH